MDPEKNGSVVTGSIILGKVPIGDPSDIILRSQRYVQDCFTISGVAKGAVGTHVKDLEVLLAAISRIIRPLVFAKGMPLSTALTFKLPAKMTPPLVFLISSSRKSIIPGT